MYDVLNVLKDRENYTQTHAWESYCYVRCENRQKYRIYRSIFLFSKLKLTVDLSLKLDKLFELFNYNVENENYTWNAACLIYNGTFILFLYDFIDLFVNYSEREMQNESIRFIRRCSSCPFRNDCFKRRHKLNFIEWISLNLIQSLIFFCFLFYLNFFLKKN